MGFSSFVNIVMLFFRRKMFVSREKVIQHLTRLKNLLIMQSCLSILIYKYLILQ
jgi:hypothetical protein